MMVSQDTCGRGRRTLKIQGGVSNVGAAGNSMEGMRKKKSMNNCYGRKDLQWKNMERYHEKKSAWEDFLLWEEGRQRRWAWVGHVLANSGRLSYRPNSVLSTSSSSWVGGSLSILSGGKGLPCGLSGYRATFEF